MNNDLLRNKSARPIAIWLLAGVGMIIIQILLGGITRLTGSGLSITEWKPIMGAIPPITDAQWQEAFDKYQQIAQFKYLNAHFELSDFKFIFFWEWFHRLWARLIGIVFIIPFIIFLLQRRFKQEMIKPMIILFFLGALQGLVGWIMVMSGLEDSELLYVSHYRLAIHFILALVLLYYTFWFALKLLVPSIQEHDNRSLKKFTWVLLVLLTIQLTYGAFMAGLKAAAAAMTWPDINGSFLPEDLTQHGSRVYGGISFLFDHPLVVHFIHRTLAYIISLLIVIWTVQAYRHIGSKLFRNTRWWPIILVIIQVILGILAVLLATHASAFLWIAVSHQFVAMLLLLSLGWHYYLMKNSGK